METTPSRAEPALRLSVGAPRRVMAEDVVVSAVLRAQPMLEDPAGDVHQSQETGKGQQVGASNKDGIEDDGSRWRHSPFRSQSFLSHCTAFSTSNQ